MAENAQERVMCLLGRHNDLKAKRCSWDSFCQEIADYVMPRKAEIFTRNTSPSTARQQVLFDSTAVRSNNILGNGQLAWMTPHESSWFAFNPPEELDRNDNARQWFKRCTEIAHLEIARSNFYSEIHELYLDRGAFGTATLFAEAGRKNSLRFENWDVGTYSVQEDDEGYVDTASREFYLTSGQAAKKFGIESLAPKMREEADSKESKRQDKEHQFVHMIFPRDPMEIDPSKADPLNMPIASVYIDVENKLIVNESGFRELPFFTTRFLKWGTRTPYGWSPSWIALPEERQVNFLEKNLDALAEIAAFPRLLLPNSFKDSIDLRAGGITYWDSNIANGKPEEWATQGRYDVGLDRADRKRKAIEDAFHVDLFQMFSQIEKQMTATEVSERASEKLIQFSPTFARMTTELFNPLLQRIFALLLRGGKFPQIPPDVVLLSASGPFVPEPKISYTSRIAMSIKALENTAFSRTLQTFMPVAQIRPDVLDNFDFDKIIRDAARNDGVPASWIKSATDVQQLRDARAQAQQQQAQAEQAQMMADAAGKAGSIKPESAVGRMIENAA